MFPEVSNSGRYLKISSLTYNAKYQVWIAKQI